MESNKIISFLTSLLLHTTFFLICIIPLKKKAITSGYGKSIQFEFEKFDYNHLENKPEEKVSEKKYNNISKTQNFKKKIIEKKETIESKKISTKATKQDAIQDTTEKKKGNNKNNANIAAKENSKNKSTEIDKRAIYKSSDTNEISNAILEMKGWTWESAPKPKDETDEIGKIVFKIKINAYGEVIDIDTLERNVSILVENIYRESLENIIFIKTTKESDEDQQYFYGKVTFYIKYK